MTSWTIGQLLNWTKEHLAKCGSESPRLDAEVLLAHACQCERIALYTRFDEVVGDEPRAAFRELVKRRAAGEPVAYLVGQKEFFSLPLRVTPDVLIPRPDTEHVVSLALDLLKQRGAEAAPAVVADVGCGSGAIALAVAKHAPRARLIATDLSPAALAVARDNAERLGLAERIAFYEGDLLDAAPADERLDLVLSNPPYIGEAERDTLAPGVRDHEPPLALFGGEQGTDVIARLIPQAAERLVPGGWLVCEISPFIHSAVLALFAQEPRFQPALASKDLGGQWRVASAQKKPAG